jgi:UDP-N-acetylmuramyl pentapeptide phosphotransferase/UDP-N-acetylglucosamine-1-phosphate transferase
VLSAITSYFLNKYIYGIFSNNKIIDPITSRSSHRSKATRSGGLSVFLSICICFAIAASTNSLVVNPYGLLGIIFMALTGIADDFFNVRYREKFFLQIFSGIILLQAGYEINSFHGIFGIYELPGWGATTVTLFVYIIIVNAINLIDGLDGLASLLLIKFFVVVGGIVMVGTSDMALFFPIAVGALLGFLLHNFSSVSKVFLGDTGSLFMGSIMAFFIFYIMDSSSQIVIDAFISRPLFCVLLLIYPLTDTLRVILLRSYKSRSPFVADRIHLHHRLADKGYEHWEASLLIFCLSLSLLSINLFLFQYIGLILCVLVSLALMLLSFFVFFK